MSAMLGLVVLVSVGAFVGDASRPIALAVSALSLIAVLRVRLTNGRRRVDLARQLLAALMIVAAASPVLASDLFRLNGPGYIWIAGQARPCLAFGGGHDVSMLPISLFGLPFTFLGLLIATKADREPPIPRRGALIGLGLVVLWILTVGADHAKFASLVGCA